MSNSVLSAVSTAVFVRSPRAAKRGLFGLLGALLLARPARAQEDPFAVLDGPAPAGGDAGAGAGDAAGAAVEVAPPPPVACDDIAAAAAAGDFNIFIGAVVGVAALLGVALWFGLERKAFSSWVVRWITGALFAGLAAGGLVYANPFASEAAQRLMAESACQHHFLLASSGAVGQGLVLGFLPAVAITFVLVLFARRVL